MMGQPMIVLSVVNPLRWFMDHAVVHERTGGVGARDRGDTASPALRSGTVRPGRTTGLPVHYEPGVGLSQRHSASSKW